MEERATLVQTQTMSLKDRMKLLMQEQLEREQRITKTDFAADVADVDLKAKKAAMDKAKAVKKSKKQWDIAADLADREQTATAIMALFNRQAEQAAAENVSSRRANRQTKWHLRKQTVKKKSLN